MTTINTHDQGWRELYRAALSETDRRMIPWRIRQAEDALFARARALFPATGDEDEEVQAIDDALYALRALRGCVVLDPAERRRGPRPTE